ncbi:gamma-glutamylcyclotransferase [Ketobacter sp. MCCC 1A13808]|uniref:gamma-glutamylcyclotransferase n=1 Tax=Ketobacter sp. MCCC 1A13808 TaxID=2602738 RepID=UPI000F105964|nr:gamma-glutamylcyclotransferase [Ketobacter sp. MCCC 1A13808]MVF11480.1 gamma-glutamylcyclotransferase [Ketobacter sp. MCCC 1A13808]RLP54570.1 MAG: gamma-glutamylcyclotransferase [Ketobacter sp.]
MPANTIETNQMMTQFSEQKTLWLFGYGSLIYKADFPYLQRQPARIMNWSRRFWQGSHDHRGTPEKPGRVVTLIEDPGRVCEGMAYLITPEEFLHLDHREKNGYLRLATEILFRDDSCVNGVMYIASAENSAYLGPASEQEIAVHIANSEGPSGKNADYLLQLADALRELDEKDDHVFAIEQYLQTIQSEKN